MVIRPGHLYIIRDPLRWAGDYDWSLPMLVLGPSLHHSMLWRVLLGDQVIEDVAIHNTLSIVEVL